MDSLQAAILNFRLLNLKKIINKRRKNVESYLKYLNLKKIYFPLEKLAEFNTYHTFVIQVDRRDELKNFLKKRGIDTTIHYPVPIHLQTASKYLGYKKGSFPETENQAKKILTLPIHQYLEQPSASTIHIKCSHQPSSSTIFINHFDRPSSIIRINHPRQ